MGDSYLPIMNILGPHCHIQVVFGRLTLQVFQVPAFLISLIIFFRLQNIYFFISPICKSVFYICIVTQEFLNHPKTFLIEKYYVEVKYLFTH